MYGIVIWNVNDVVLSDLSRGRSATLRSSGGAPFTSSKRSSAHYLLVGVCGAIVYDYESQEQQSVCTASQCIVFTVVEDYWTQDVGERSCLLFLCSAT